MSIEPHDGVLAVGQWGREGLAVTEEWIARWDRGARGWCGVVVSIVSRGLAGTRGLLPMEVGRPEDDLAGWGRQC